MPGRARHYLLPAAVALIAAVGLGWHAHHRPTRPSASGWAAPAAPLPRFVDVTADAGVTFRHIRASSGRKYFVETMGAGVAFIDFDNDGRQDLFLVNGAPLPGFRPSGRILPALYRNLGLRGGRPRFQDVTRKAGLDIQMYGMGCAVGDYDNDGWDDLYVTAALGPSRLFRNLGGRFNEVTRAAGVDNRRRFGASAAWVDFDKDGDLDLYVTNYVRYNSVADDMPCYFKPNVRSYCIPFAYKPEENCLYRNDGNGRFTDVTRQARLDRPAGKSLGVAIADYDHDSWPDLFVANDTTPTHLFHNNADGTFAEVAPASSIAYGPSGAAKAGMGIDIADDRNNGQFSVAIGNFSAEMVAYYQHTGQHFFDERSVQVGLGQPSRSFLTFGTLFLDADNDGWKDLFLANGHVQDDVALFHVDISYRQRPLFFRNLGSARYAEAGLQAGFTDAIVARGAARGDLDDDGRPDLVVTCNNGRAHLWRNVVQNGGHWLKVRLRGVRSNRNGFGSRLALSTGAMRQTAELQSGSSYLSQNDQRVHFGLGGARRVDRLEVRWPSGAVSVLTDVPADRLLTIVEADG